MHKEKKPLTQLLQETKEGVRINIERVIDRDMDGKPGMMKFRRLFPEAAAKLFEGFWNYHRKRNIIFWLEFYARFVTCHCLWAIVEDNPDTYENLVNAEGLDVDDILGILVEFEEDNRDKLFPRAEKELEEALEKHGIPTLKIVK